MTRLIRSLFTFGRIFIFVNILPCGLFKMLALHSMVSTESVKYTIVKFFARNINRIASYKNNLLSRLGHRILTKSWHSSRISLRSIFLDLIFLIMIHTRGSSYKIRKNDFLMLNSQGKYRAPNAWFRLLFTTKAISRENIPKYIYHERRAFDQTRNEFG